MKTSLRIGGIALIMLSIFSSVALADPPNGGDAGNTIGSATPIQVVPNTWNIYPNGWIGPYGPPGDQDFYKPNTRRLDVLLFDLDQQAIKDGAVLEAYNGLTKINAQNTGQFTVTSSDGSSYINVHAVFPPDTPYYQFALNILR